MKGKKKRKKWIWLMILSGSILWLGRYLTEQFIPSLREMAIMQANSLASDILAQAMEDIIRENHLEGKEFVTYFRDETGKIFAYTIDTVTINLLTSEAVSRMNEIAARSEDMIVRIPIGTVTNNSLLAGLGIDIPVHVRLTGNTGANYEREFTAAGINEINHRVWIRMEVAFQVAAPLMSEVLTSCMDFPIVDQYISGDTPLTYLGVAP